MLRECLDAERREGGEDGGKVYRREGGRGFMVAASLAPTLSFLVSQHSASPVALASFQA